MASDGTAGAIVRTVLQLADTLDCTVVAEGVETVGQRDMLLRLGVDHGQGWLFGRPEPFFAAIDMRSRVPVMPTAGRHPAS